MDLSKYGKTNLEALYGKTDPCKHEVKASEAWRQLNENTEILFITCVDCGKTVEILTRKIKKWIK
jgi:Fe2+ or Zn2+ uptake regulation protein